MPQKDMFFPELFSIVSTLEVKRFTICSAWVKLDSVNAVFKSHKISPIKFRDNYAIPIFEFFLAVVKEEKNVGNCPVMSKLVNYLLEKNITPKDVFDICMGIRRILINYIFSKNLIPVNHTQVLEEIAKIFDLNLSGVLEIFTRFYSAKQESLQKSFSQQKKFNQLLKIINFVSTKIIVVQSGRVIMCNKSLYETLGVSSLKGLHEKFENNFSFLKDVEVFSANSSTQIENWIREQTDSKKMFNTTVYSYQEKKNVHFSGRVGAISEDGESPKYIITLDSLEQKHFEDNKQVKNRLEHDEFTGLLNYAKFSSLAKKLKENTLEKSKKLALIVIDIPYLKEINLTKGSDYGDDLIMQSANTLKETLKNYLALARLEGSRFGVAMHYESEQEVYNLCASLQIELDKHPEKKLISLTSFEKSESVNKTIMRSYHLVEMIASLDDKIISTDFQDVRTYEPLTNQNKFTKALIEMNKIAGVMYYKGLLVPFENKILRVDEKSILLQVTSKEIRMAKLQKGIYLEFPHYGVVKAEISNANAYDYTFEIHKFKFTYHNPLNREKFRVEAAINTKVAIMAQNVSIEATLFDLNDEYISVKVKKKRYLDEGVSITLETYLELENFSRRFIGAGTVYKVIELEKYYQIVILCDMDSENSTILKSYLSARQLDIIQELKGE
jgi:diguanylate cyclase (GGDEF)-like protein